MTGTGDRRAALRAFWEEAIPRDVAVMFLSDALRYIEAALYADDGAPLPEGIRRGRFITKRTLQRHAGNKLDTLGGPGTPVRGFRVTRKALIEYLLAFDSLYAEPPEPPKKGRKRKRNGGRKKKKTKSEPPPRPEGDPLQLKLFG